MYKALLWAVIATAGSAALIWLAAAGWLVCCVVTGQDVTPAIIAYWIAAAWLLAISKLADWLAAKHKQQLVNFGGSNGKQQ